MKKMIIDAAMNEKSYFPNQDSSFESLPDIENNKTFDEILYTDFEDRVNS